MGWNTSAFFVRGSTPQELLTFVSDDCQYSPVPGHVTADEATSGGHDRIYLAQTADWCQLWDPLMQIVPGADDLVERRGPQPLAGTTALAVILQSVTGTYGFWVYEDAELVRRAIYGDGRALDLEGDPLPFEARLEVPAWGHDEDFVWAAIEAVTGVTWESMQQQAFDAYTPV